MNATYYKDTMHSYMIIPCPPEAETTGYQYRMLEMNRIEGILPCGLRHIDGESFLYYETTGRQSLSALYEGRKIPGAELFRLLEALYEVSGTLSEYLRAVTALPYKTWQGILPARVRGGNWGRN